MTIQLPEDLEQGIRATVSSGAFATEDEAVAEAVRQFLGRNHPRPPVATPPRKPIWEIADEIRKSVPEEEWAKLPGDGAAQHDHYIYGSPKRPTS
jgi:Arc/MetJ-type ribon-helix-helix transcriptional regulator